MIVIFTLALFTGTAAIAAWIATRFPKLAPASMRRRVISAAVSLVALELAPVATGGGTAVLYLTVFILAIVLLAVWLSTLWMLLAVRDLIA
jgi:hypothetical protein